MKNPVKSSVKHSRKQSVFYFLFISTVSAITALGMSGCSTAASAEKNTPITLNEVAHSIFYAPQYAAIELGYFEEEGIDLTLVNGAGADKVMTALISRSGLWALKQVFMSARKAQLIQPSILPS